MNRKRAKYMTSVLGILGAALAVFTILCLLLNTCDGTVKSLRGSYGVTAEGTFPADTSLMVTKLSDENADYAHTVSMLPDGAGTVLGVFRMALEAKNETVEPNGTVRITMKIPSSAETCTVYRAEDASLTHLSADANGGTVTFETGFLGLFLLTSEV